MLSDENYKTTVGILENRYGKEEDTCIVNNMYIAIYKTMEITPY